MDHWTAYASAALLIGCVVCFLRGCFLFSWQGLSWMLWSPVLGAAGIAFGLAAIFK